MGGIKLLCTVSIKNDILRMSFIAHPHGFCCGDSPAIHGNAREAQILCGANGGCHKVRV